MKPYGICFSLSSDSTSGYIVEDTQNTNLKKMHFYVSRHITYNSQGMEATQVPINRLVDK